MKKKSGKTVVLKDSDLSRADVNILEANQSQQTVILKFFTENNLSKFSLAICRISPLLNSPEKVENTFFSPVDCPVEQNQKVYLIFGDQDDSRTLDEDGNIILHINFKKPFQVKDDEVIALIENEPEQQKIIDWCKPIIDEPLLPDTLEVLKERVKQIESSGQQFYKKKTTSEIKNDRSDEKSWSINGYSFWILSFIGLVSIFELISVFSFSESPLKIALKIFLILLKNSFIAFFIFRWINSTNRTSRTFLLLFILLIIVIFSESWYIGIYLSLLCSLILSLIVSIFTFRFARMEKNNIEPKV
jgi:hypothetical protein